MKSKAHPYLGLLRCGGVLLDKTGQPTDQACGSTVTAEEKRKRLASGEIKLFYYYHCSRNSGPNGGCSERDQRYVARVNGRTRLNFSEAEIGTLFEVIVKPLSFTPEVAEWMKDALLEDCGEKTHTHESELSSLQFQVRLLDRKISSVYQDKVDGKIDEALWKKTHDRLSAEMRSLEHSLDAIHEARGDYLERGSLLIELVRNTENVYRNSNPEMKRKIIEIVSSNHFLAGGSLRFNYRKPFDLLASAHDQKKWWSLTYSNR